MSTYVVVEEGRGVLMLGHYSDTPRAGVLMHSGKEATLFPN